MIRVNLLGVVYAIEAVLPEMLKRGQGHLAAVSSMAAYKGLPGESAYCASKAAVNTYMEGLRIQLRHRGLAVTTICPGFVATPMTEVRGGPVASDDPKRYAGLRKILSAPVPKGQNLVVSSHANPFRAITGLPYLAEGEIAVVQPEGNDRFSIVGRITLQDW